MTPVIAGSINAPQAHKSNSYRPAPKVRYVLIFLRAQNLGILAYLRAFSDITSLSVKTKVKISISNLKFLGFVFFSLIKVSYTNS